MLVSSLRFALAVSIVFTLFGCTSATVRFAPGEIPVHQASSEHVTQRSEAGIKELLKHSKISAQPKYTKRVEQILGRLLEVTPSSAHWRAYIVENTSWNAMTAPGNIVVVFTGILDDLKSDDELAAVLGHEIGHRLAMHEVKSTGESIGGLVSVLGGLAVGIAVASDQTSTRQDVNQAANLTAAILQGAVVNPYSQVKETEADLIGVFLMADAGYNPQKAALVWQNQAKKKGKSNAIDKFFSTHPPSEERHQFLLQNLSAAQERYLIATKNRKHTVKNFKPKSRKPYEPSPELASDFNKGQEQLENTDFTAAINTFAKIESADHRFLEATVSKGLAQAYSGDILNAQASFKAAIKRDPSYALAHYNLACANAQMNKKADALTHLMQAIKLDPKYKATALKDPDFSQFRSDAEFKRVTKGGGATFSLNAL